MAERLALVGVEEAELVARTFFGQEYHLAFGVCRSSLREAEVVAGGWVSIVTPVNDSSLVLVCQRSMGGYLRFEAAKIPGQGGNPDGLEYRLLAPDPKDPDKLTPVIAGIDSPAYYSGSLF